ncbi:thioredoxin domain-containing protein [Erythrobacter arachoides]|uniref:Thioredoxin domain-containing protein n=1 Tax=Aurantiacibacter arachoides TaxID=1850444 RepID=A0A845AAJ5_9SPHN|nr:DsbA family protein [Aurantiacibacter arachoides]MXO94579.1 thioredoxin domain-containing protein [Aurantiacibacter arachoides]GGD62376.1 outer membrane protein [Aurantiacibacter arachoides]
MRLLVTIAIALVAGVAGAAAWDFAGFAPDRTRAYLMANPEVLPEAMAELQRRDMAARVAPIRAELEQPFPGAVLGNPEGSVTLVEFSDYACGYCRLSVGHVNALIAQNPDLRVVIREYPILSEGSANAARMALAAAQQGKFEAFHNAMFEQDQPSPEGIRAAAEAAGVDLAQANAAIASGALDTQLQNNVFLGQTLQLSGTPAFIVGDTVLNGAVGTEQLSEAIAEARDS